VTEQLPNTPDDLRSELSKTEKMRLAWHTVNIGLIASIAINAFIASEKADNEDTLAFAFFAGAFVSAAAWAKTVLKAEPLSRNSEQLIDDATSQGLSVTGKIYRRISGPEENIAA